MKKILSLTLMALTLCVQHESYARANLRSYAGRLGQQCQRLYSQGAQRVAPAYRSFSTGLSNIRPQISQQFRNMQSSARNWSQNLPTKQQVARTLGLATAGSGAIVGGAGLGMYGTLKYLKARNVVQAEEEETATDALNKLKAEFNEITHRSHSQQEIISLKNKLQMLALNNPIYDRKTFASMVNELLVELKGSRHTDYLYDELKHNIESTGNIKTGALIFLAQAINGDITLINAVNDLADVADSGDPTVKLVIPTVYGGFFHRIGKDPEIKEALLEAINTLNQPISLNEAVKNDDSDISDKAKILRESRRFQNKHKLLDQITKMIEQKEDPWWWPSYFNSK